MRKMFREIKEKSGGQPVIVGTLVIMLTHIGLIGYWFGMYEWIKYQPPRNVSLIVAFAASIIASVLVFIGFRTKPKEGWRPKSVWGPLLVVLGFAFTFFFLLTLIKLL